MQLNARNEGYMDQKHRREHAKALLNEVDARFESHSMGAHLIIQSKHGLIDFWPATGLFIYRMSGLKGRGIERLISYITT